MDLFESYNKELVAWEDRMIKEGHPECLRKKTAKKAKLAKKTTKAKSTAKKTAKKAKKTKKAKSEE